MRRREPPEPARKGRVRRERPAAHAYPGALPALTFHGLTMDRGFFLRPLFYLIVPAVTTLSWKAQWPARSLKNSFSPLLTPAVP